MKGRELARIASVSGPFPGIASDSRYSNFEASAMKDKRNVLEVAASYQREEGWDIWRKRVTRRTRDWRGAESGASPKMGKQLSPGCR